MALLPSASRLGALRRPRTGRLTSSASRSSGVLSAAHSVEGFRFALSASASADAQVPRRASDAMTSLHVQVQIRSARPEAEPIRAAGGCAMPPVRGECWHGERGPVRGAQARSGQRSACRGGWVGAWALKGECWYGERGPVRGAQARSGQRSACRGGWVGAWALRGECLGNCPGLGRGDVR
jgi:hypothetical protein